jgi:glycosyltransferase involved in cell wall biosynthesis
MPRRWVAIVPAHNEEMLIGACVDSLVESGKRLPMPPVILVVADNCEDETARIAIEHGATVLERHDLTQRGKGFALEYAMRHLALASRDRPEIVAFIDADSIVEPDFFAEMQRSVQGGALASQAYYEVAAQPGDLTSLRRLAFMVLHWSRPLGLTRLHLGSGLKGNGMALRWDVASAGLGSVGIAEDAAMTLALAQRGIPVTFVPRARVSGFMAATFREAEVQDSRWEQGRLGMMPHAIRAAANALRDGNPAAAAGAIDLAAPPLTLVGGVALVLSALQLVLPITGGWLAFVALGGTVAYLAVGLAAARASRQELLALRMAPRFAFYKARVLLSLLRPNRDTEWRRTSRPSAPR